MATSKKTKSVIKGIKKNLKKKDYEIVNIKIKKIPKKTSKPRKKVAKVLNPVTGRLIVKEGSRFNELIEEGYTFRVIKKKVKSRIAGYLVPPEKVIKKIAKSENTTTKAVKTEINKNLEKNEVPTQNAREKFGSFMGGIATSILSGGAKNNNGGREKANVVSSNNMGAKRNNNRGVGEEKTNVVSSNNMGARRNNNIGERRNNNTGERRNNNRGVGVIGEEGVTQVSSNNMGARRNNNNMGGAAVNNKKGVGVIGQEGVTQVSSQNGRENGGGLVKNNGSNRPAAVERKPENFTEIKRNNSGNVVTTGGEGVAMGKPSSGFKAKEPEKNNQFDKALVAEGSKINS